MRWFPSRRSRDDDLAEELRTHLEMSTEDYVKRGESPSDAAAAARRQFGNVGIVAEVTREAWGAGWLERLQHDLTFGARLLRRRPAFAVVAISSLALGIGATGAVYGVVDTLLFRQLPLPAPQQLISLAVRYPGETSNRANFSFDAFKRIRDVVASARFAAECIVDRARIFVENGSTPIDARVSLVTAEYFSVLQAMPRLGRAISSDDDAARGAGPVAVISDAIWRDAFQRRADIIGRRFLLGQVHYSVIGVMPPGFVGDWPARPVAIWVPIAMQSTAMPEEPGLLDAPFNEWVRIIGRVPSASATAALVPPAQQAFLRWANDMFSPAMLAFVSQARVTAESMERGYSPEREALARPLIVFLSIVILVLIVACSNVANLTLAHAASREREMSLRIALGAGRFRLARQALTEAGLLAGTAALIGMLLAVWGSAWLRAFVANDSVHTAHDVAPSWAAIVASTLACLTVCAVFSILSSVRLTAASNVSQLVGRNAGSTEPRHWKMIGRVLLVAQIALSLALVMSSGLFARTLHNLRTQPLGFTRDHVVLLWASPAQAGINGPALSQVYSAVRARVAALPGVASTGVSHGNVGGSGFLTGVVFDAPVSLIDDQPVPAPQARVTWHVATPGFLDALGMRVERGRDFRESDGPGTTAVAIITQSTARLLFPGRDPIGRKFGFKRDVTFEVIGVVQDTRFSSPRNDRQLIAFVSYRQNISAGGRHGDMLVAIRTSGNESAVATTARAAIAELVPGVPIIRVATVSEELDRALSQERLLASLASLFGALAVFIACSGVYGTVAYRISRSTREIGIRMAIGATRARVVRWVIAESAWITALGAAIGLVVGLTATRAIASLLYGVTFGNAGVIVGSVTVLMTAATLAAFIPAGRISRRAPVEALRHD